MTNDIGVMTVAPASITPEDRYTPGTGRRPKKGLAPLQVFFRPMGSKSTTPPRGWSHARPHDLNQTAPFLGHFGCVGLPLCPGDPFEVPLRPRIRRMQRRCHKKTKLNADKHIKLCYFKGLEMHANLIALTAKAIKDPVILHRIGQ